MKKNADSDLMAAPEYRRFIEDLKTRVVPARISAARSVNRELTLLYWDIGRAIVEKQRVLGWGESVTDQVSVDLQEAFPATTGFSPRNLRDMKRFYLAYADETIWQQVVAKLVSFFAPKRTTWRSNMPSGPERGFRLTHRCPV